METTPLRVLFVEDDENDRQLVALELGEAGYELTTERVETCPEMAAALDRGAWDLILADYSLPRFSGPAAVALVRSRGLDVPVIMISGSIDEEHAVESMKAGAQDFVTKARLARLGPAVARELREAENRRARRRAEEEMRRQRESLYQAEKLAAMGQLLAGVAHELNNPMAVVIGQALLLQRDLGGSGPAAARIEKVVSAAERCGRIVRNFLSLARHQPPERRRVDVNPIVQDAVELLAYPLRVDGIEVRLDLDPRGAILEGDPHQLHQLLINLLTNAQHALRESARPRAIGLCTRASAERITLEVSDNGPGVPPELTSRVFDPFFTTKPAGEGTGLGLPLSRSIVEGHGGTIALESGAGTGATFRIELPVGRPPTPEVEAPRPAEAAGRAASRSILVVDDEPAVADILADLLREDGHAVDTAGDGIAALARLADKHYDLVVSDLRMPNLDGPGLYEEVARRLPGMEARFVFVTGDTFTPRTREFLESCRRPHFGKPFTIEDVRRAVRDSLEKP